MNARDVKPSMRWATRNKWTWYFLGFLSLPIYLMVESLIGFVAGLKEWYTDFNDPKDLGCWHKKERKENK